MRTCARPYSIDVPKENEKYEQESARLSDNGRYKKLAQRLGIRPKSL